MTSLVEVNFFCMFRVSRTHIKG